MIVTTRSYAIMPPEYDAEMNRKVDQNMKFQGTADYVATNDLKIAVNAAVALERPLLVKGEPGTGKTELARQVSQALGLRHQPARKLLYW